jgi:group I intron endonuclease
MSFIIYIVENAVSPAVYIGQTVRTLKARWGVHKSRLRGNYHGNPHMQAAWNKYGEEAFTCRVLKTYETLEELNRAEIAAIALYRASGVEVYNGTDGGEGAPGRKQSDSEREMRSRVAREALSTPEARQRKKEGSLKRWSNLEEREKQSQRMREAQTEDGQRRKTSAQVKLWNDPEHRRRRMSALTEAWASEEYKEKLRQGQIRRYTDPTARQKTSDANKKRFENPLERERARRQLLERYGYTYTLIAPDGQSYTTRNLAAFCQEHNLGDRSIRRVCAGIQREYKGWTGSRVKEEVPP